MTRLEEIEDILKHFPPERLQALKVWLTCDAQGTGDTECAAEESSALETLSEEAIAEVSDVETCYHLLNKLELNELVAFSLMQEFGPGFSGHNAYSPLQRSVTQKLAELV